MSIYLALAVCQAIAYVSSVPCPVQYSHLFKGLVIIISILQTKKQRFTEIKQLIQTHTEKLF